MKNLRSTVKHRPNTTSLVTLPLVTLLGVIGLAGCASTEQNIATDNKSESVSGHTHDTNHSHTDHTADTHNIEHFKSVFSSDSVEVADELVECTLASGTQTQCYEVTVAVNKDMQHETGPWCPRNINDGPEKSGIWLDSGKVYDADGEFIKNLSSFYGDDEWELYNPITGKVKVTESKEACLAAAKPDVEAEYQNYCVECQPEYTEVSNITYLIPAHPKAGDESYRVNQSTGVGIARDGIKFDASAPTDAILSAHTLAPFDDFGGHVNPHVGYHYHAVTDKTSEAIGSVEKHSTLIGYAMDGHLLFTNLNSDSKAPTDLDECNGHEVEGLGYHYHAGEAGSNVILQCFKSEPGCNVEAGETVCTSDDRGGRGQPPVDAEGNLLPPPDRD